MNYTKVKTEEGSLVCTALGWGLQMPDLITVAAAVVVVVVAVVGSGVNTNHSRHFPMQSFLPDTMLAVVLS